MDDDTDTVSSEAEHSASEYQPSEQSSLSSRNSHLQPFEDSPRKRDEFAALNICEDSHQSEAVSVQYPMLVEDQLRKNYLFIFMVNLNVTSSLKVHVHSV